MRNLVVCRDGTWNTAEQQHDGVPVPAGVVRLYNVLADKGAGGIEQLERYHESASPSLARMGEKRP